MPNPSLITYITQLRSSNIPDETIKSELIKNGWQELEVQAALAPLNQSAAPILPPPPVPRFSMWVSFQYVILFVSLWIWSTAIGGIWHYAINKHIPDNLAQASYSYSSMMGNTLLQGYLAAIMVSYPFFVILFITLNKQIVLNPGVRNIKTRKFLIYFTLVVYFIYMLIQLITTLVGFLAATASTTTLPNLSVNLLIPGMIGFYLLKAVREDRRSFV